ncbi:MAG: LysM peptidoglycan-binding domain-containing protein [Planctomycetota bacterium]
MRKDIKIGLVVGAVLIVLFVIIWRRNNNTGDSGIGLPTEDAVVTPGVDTSPLPVVAATPATPLVVAGGPTGGDTMNIRVGGPAAGDGGLMGGPGPGVAGDFGGTVVDGDLPAGGREETHVVAKGDTLGGIAKRYYGDESKHVLISKANPGVNPRNLKIGTKLVIPAAPNKGHDRISDTHGGATGGGKSYTVKKGDSLWKIAKETYGDGNMAKKIRDANNLTDDNLKIGQKLVLPGKGGDVIEEAPMRDPFRPMEATPPVTSGPARTPHATVTY